MSFYQKYPWARPAGQAAPASSNTTAWFVVAVVIGGLAVYEYGKHRLAYYR